MARWWRWSARRAWANHVWSMSACRPTRTRVAGVESASVSYGKATPYFPVIDLLKRYCHVEDTTTPDHPGQGDRAGADARPGPPGHGPGVAGAPGRRAGGQPVPQARSPAAAPASSMPSNACCCARARSSPCGWCSRICTGLIPRRRPSSIGWWRACRPPACCSW